MAITLPTNGQSNWDVPLNNALTALDTAVTLKAPIASPTFTGTVTLPSVTWPTKNILQNVTAANLLSAANAINTTNKSAGKMVWQSDSTPKIKIATGSLATSTWVNADGTSAITPV